MSKVQHFKYNILEKNLTASDGFDTSAAKLKAENSKAGRSEIEAKNKLAISKAPTTEWECRVQLAAAYRLADMYGWTEGIGNHFSCRVPENPSHFLINRYGEGFGEVTASSLVKIDHEGNIVDEHNKDAAINLAGFVIHSCVHHARDDCFAVFHTHETNITAVSNMKCGLLPLNQTALLNGAVAYHDYEGVAVSDEERVTLARDLGDKSVMILRNHGVLTTGSSIAEGFTRLFYATKAAEIQVKTMGVRNDTDHISFPSTNVQKLVKERQGFDNAGNSSVAEATFQMWMRKLNRFNPGYDK
eukprot:g1549.t1